MEKTDLGTISLKEEMLSDGWKTQPLVPVSVCVHAPSVNVFVCLIDVLLICRGLPFPRFHVCLQLLTDS